MCSRSLALLLIFLLQYVNTELSGSVATCAIDSESGLTVLNIKPCYPEGFVGQDHPQVMMLLVLLSC